MAAPGGAAVAGRPAVDIVVVGAGIIGLATARELQLRDPRRQIAVVDKEQRVGAHQTGHNSGVIHAGVYYEPGSLKARLCRAGMAATYEFCDRHGIEARRVGKLIVATSAAQLPALGALQARAQANGVAFRRLDDAEAIAAVEPHVTAVAALHVHETGIADFTAIARALADELREGGAAIRLGFEVRRASARGGAIELDAPSGSIRARNAIFCAGLQSDRLARLLGAQRDPQIVPFRGRYLRLTAERRELCRGLIYPVPDPQLPFLGVHLTRHIGGDVLVGPTALLAGSREHYGRWRPDPRDLAQTVGNPGSWRMMRRFWRAGANELRMALSTRALVGAAAQLVPALEPGDVRDGPVGVRAQAVGRDGRLIDDFAFSQSQRALHVRNAPSPGATSALAIARAIADRADAQFR
jgi:(S)-2-hydroxyglutarate dehydrogenase